MPLLLSVPVSSWYVGYIIFLVLLRAWMTGVLFRGGRPVLRADHAYPHPGRCSLALPHRHLSNKDVWDHRSGTQGLCLTISVLLQVTGPELKTLVSEADIHLPPAEAPAV